MTQLDREFDFTKPLVNKKANKKNKLIIGLGLIVSGTLFIGSSNSILDNNVKSQKSEYKVMPVFNDSAVNYQDASVIFNKNQVLDLESLMKKFNIKELHIAKSLEGNSETLFISYINNNSEKINIKEYAYQDADILVNGDYNAPMVLSMEKGKLKIKNTEQFFNNPDISAIKDKNSIVKNDYLHSQLNYLLHRIGRSEIFEEYAKTGKLLSITKSEVPYIYDSYIDEAKMKHGYFWLNNPFFNKVNEDIFAEFKKNGWNMSNNQVCDLMSVASVNNFGTNSLRQTLLEGQTCQINKVDFSPNVINLSNK
jgi:hypothetical protein